MSDPLSSLASVITIVGCATESIKVVVKLVRGFSNAPAEVHQWLTMLESLQSTLSSLQQGGRNLNPEHQFPLRLQQRLVSCVAQLQLCTKDIARADASMEKTSSNGKRKWDTSTRKSWEKAKWAVVGDSKMKKIMKTIHFYHFEFVMELLNILITVERTLPPPSIMPPKSEFRHTEQHQSIGLVGQPKLSHGRSPEKPLISNSTFGSLKDTNTKLAVNPLPKQLLAAAEYKGVDTSQTPIISIPWIHQSMKSAISVYWNILACRFITRVGTFIELRSESSRRTQSRRYRQIGLGLILTIYLPLRFRQKLGTDLCDIQLMWTSRTRVPLNLGLRFARTVSPDAEIFQSARAGLTENIKRLLSLGEASPKDRTAFGTTLLHSAARSGSLDLVRLLIQEGADVNGQDEDGESPLHGAMAKNNNYDVARTLIENGADLSSQAVDGKTPFHSIFNNTISHVLLRDDWLENVLPDSEGMSITHFLAWSSKSTPEIFQRGQLYDYADLFSADGLGRTCLHLAASRGNLGVLSHLSRLASPEDVEKKDHRGRTPLHYAVQSSRAAGAIDILVDMDCNVFALDDSGLTAFHWAAQWNNLKAIEKLIAIVNEENHFSADINGYLHSKEVIGKRALALYEYLKDLRSFSASSKKQSMTIRLDRGRARCGFELKFSLIMEIVGALAVCFMIFLGTPG